MSPESAAAGLDRRVADALDRNAIIDQLSRYCFAVDFGEWHLLDSVFAEDVDATYILPPGIDDIHRTDRDGIVGWLRSVLGERSLQAPMHAMTNHLVTVEGDTARSRSYLAGGTGTYIARWRRSGDTWQATEWEMRNYSRDDAIRNMTETNRSPGGG